MMCYSLNGCKTGVKYTLRCRQCNVTYITMRDKLSGFLFYSRPREYVEVCYVWELSQRIHRYIHNYVASIDFSLLMTRYYLTNNMHC